MNEPRELVFARKHLERTERAFGSAEALVELQNGLALLEEVSEMQEPFASLATRIASTYATKICAHVSAQLHQDPHLPEPMVEHLFNLLRAFDGSIASVPPETRDLKIGLARRLIDFYLEGHSVEQKNQALQQLLDISAQ